jgi:hypothetical protein
MPFARKGRSSHHRLGPRGWCASGGASLSLGSLAPYAESQKQAARPDAS